MYPRELWNHWDNFGPRTTNHAEGYHSLLNRVDIDQLHPSLHQFLTKLQLMHNRWQQQIGRLQRGVVAPEPGDPMYVNLHNQIIASRAQFEQRTQHFWNVFNFNAALMHPNDFQFLCGEIDLYLQHIKHLLGYNIAA